MDEFTRTRDLYLKEKKRTRLSRKRRGW